MDSNNSIDDILERRAAVPVARDDLAADIVRKALAQKPPKGFVLWFSHMRRAARIPKPAMAIAACLVVGFVVVGAPELSLMVDVAPPVTDDLDLLLSADDLFDWGDGSSY